VSRRALTQSLAALVALALALAGGWATVPYVVLSPGPAFNTLGTVTAQDGKPAQVLSVAGHRTYPTDGALDLTTVSVSDHVTLFEALAGWFSSSKAVIPRELVYPPDKSTRQTDQENLQEMQQSQDNATTAALHELGIESTTTVRVDSVRKDAPAAGKLQVGDVLTSVDGARVTDTDGLRRLISARDIGASVLIGYLRAGKAGTVQLKTVSSGEPTPRAVIGISVATSYHFPVKVDIKLRDVGGPSAGLMFALGIIDKLEPGSLTGGRNIAGTGEISPEGAVGPIGGIAQKMRGALAAHATVFLVPADNCKEARRSKPDGLVLVKVGTLKQAIAALSTIRSGGVAPTC
jgi:PDZ domain-containing protein